MTTDREAALVARVKQLEAEVAARRIAVAQGGVFEAWWQTLKKIVPAPLAVAAVAVFLVHHGFLYYVQTQVIEAETQLKEAQSVTAKLQADALNGKAGPEALRVATLRAETEKKQAEAARARTEAAAQNTDIDNESARLATLKAQLENTQNQARLARAKADAESETSGLRTLQERAVQAKTEMQQLAAFEAKGVAAQLKAENDHDIMDMASQSRAYVEADCTGNPYAQVIGCPARYVRVKQVDPQPQASPAADGATALDRGGAGFATINTLNANLRSCPEASSRCAPLATVPQGFRVRLLGQADNGWFNVEVTSGGKTYRGYISAKVLNVE